MLSDTRGVATRDGLRARLAINDKARDLSRVYFEVQRALAAVSTELDAARGKNADALVDSVALQAATLMARARGNSIVSGIGRVFDLTAAIESSSLPPTDAQERTLQAAVAEFVDIATKVNELVSARMPAVRAATGMAAPSGVLRVTPP